MRLFCHLLSGDSEVTCFCGEGGRVLSFQCDYSASEKKKKLTEFPLHQPKEEEEGGEEAELVALSLSHDGSFLCGVFSNKRMNCWSVSGELLGFTRLHKKPTALLCTSLSLSSSSKQVPVALVADKGGEVWAYPLPSLAKTSKLLGHTSSIITDMMMNPAGNSLVTTDRDEKIRVTAFPQTNTINGFCLRHSNVVSSVSFLQLPQAGDASVLVSVGWDHKLCLWDAQNCTELDSGLLASSKTSAASKSKNREIETSEDSCNDKETNAESEKAYDENEAGNFPLRVITSQCSSRLAVIFWKSSSICIYDAIVQSQDIGLNKSNDNMVLPLDTVDLPAPPVDCLFIDDSRLLILLPSPHFMVIREISSSAQTECPRIWTAISGFYNEIALSKEFDLKQRLVFADESMEEIKKHALDRPYANAPKKKGRPNKKKTEDQQ